MSSESECDSQATDTDSSEQESSSSDENNDLQVPERKGKNLKNNQSRPKSATTTNNKSAVAVRKKAPVQSKNKGKSLDSVLISTSAKNIPDDETFTAFQVGRMKQFWKGTYKLHEFVVIKDPNNLEFCLVTTMEQDEDNRWRVITSIVLFYWISQDGKFILYPQQLIGGKGPNEWDCRVFLRFQVPQDDWFEYDIHEMVYKNGRKVKYLKAKSDMKSLKGGVPALMLSDPETVKARTRKAQRAIIAGTTTTENEASAALTIMEKNIKRRGDGPRDPSAAKKQKGNSDRLPELLNATLDGELSEPALQNDTPDTVPAHEIGNIVQKTNVTAAPLLPTNGVGEQFVPPSRTSHVELTLLQPVISTSGQTPQLPNVTQQQSCLVSPNAIPQGYRRETPASNKEVPVNDEESFIPHSPNGFLQNGNRGQFNSAGRSTDYTFPSHHSASDVFDRSESYTSYDATTGRNSTLSSFSYSNQTMQEPQRCCCDKFEDRLTRIENLVQQIHDHCIPDSGVAQSAKSSKISIDYHKGVVENNVKNLPLDDIDQLLTLEDALNDMSLSVSIVHYLFQRMDVLKGKSKNKNGFVNVAFNTLVSNQLCEEIQWKTGERKNDPRPGINGLTNVMAVIAGLRMKLVSLKQEKVEIDHFIELIQGARKKFAEEYRQANQLTDAQSKAEIAKKIAEKKEEAETNGLPIIVHECLKKKNDKDVMSDLINKINHLELAVSKFKIPK